MKSCRVDTVPWIPGGCIVGETGLGVLGAAVPSSGIDGPPFGYPGIEPADLTRECRWLLRTWPAVGLLDVAEDSSFIFSGAPDGAHDFYFEGFVDGQSVDVSVVVIVAGPQPAATGLSLSLT